jgi:glucokinase
MEKIIGIDIGGTEVKGIVWSQGKVLKEFVVPTPKDLKTFGLVLKSLVNTLDSESEIEKIGIGVAGRVNRKTFQIIDSPNLPFLNGYRFSKLIPGRYKIKLENDARCFALAESVLGQGKKYNNFIAITLGTGIGSGLVSQGKLYFGTHDNAGEIGHIPAGSKQTYEQLFQAAKVQKDVMVVGRLLGELLVTVMRTVDVQAAILGGGFTQSHYKTFLPVLRSNLKTWLKRPQLFPEVKISKIKQAGAVGAALLFQKP